MDWNIINFMYNSFVMCTVQKNWILIKFTIYVCFKTKKLFNKNFVL